MKVHVVAEKDKPIKVRSQRTINEETVFTEWEEAQDKHAAGDVAARQYAELAQLWIPGLAKKERASKARMEVQ